MYRPPLAPPAPEKDVQALARLVAEKRAVVLTGAGCSTESGIPDYRGPGQAGRVRRPIQHLEFIRSADVRQRYWARSVLGWPRFSRFRPNAAHEAIAALERTGRVAGLVTQNVDRLHHRAGSASVIELHGALARVRCLGCGDLSDRDRLQERLLSMNPGFADAWLSELRPDGDAELPPEAERAFRIAACEACDGVLKPDVVFFGDNVPRPVVEGAYSRVDAAEALVVVGSSLAVFSGYRFARRAAERGIPIAIVNLGETRADPLATLRIEGLATDVLPRVAELVRA